MKAQVLVGTLSFFLSLVVLANQNKYKPSGLCSEQVEYAHYSLCYEPEFRQASWVKHELTLRQVNGSQKRTNNYRMDPNIEDPVRGSDYRGSGFDRGHLVPAADMKLDYKSMSDTFYMTNMSPQVGNFNQGIWARLERHLRKLVKKHGDAHVITAPILNFGLKQIKSGVAIPDWYYKIIYFPDQQLVKAFLMENRRYNKGANYEDYVVTVDEIENLTGFDFFSELPDCVENHLESKIHDIQAVSQL